MFSFTIQTKMPICVSYFTYTTPKIGGGGGGGGGDFETSPKVYPMGGAFW